MLHRARDLLRAQPEPGVELRHQCGRTLRLLEETWQRPPRLLVRVVSHALPLALVLDDAVVAAGCARREPQPPLGAAGRGVVLVHLRLGLDHSSRDTNRDQAGRLWDVHSLRTEQNRF